MNLIKGLKRKTKKIIYNINSTFVEVNESPIIVLGNEKSGTTIIAALLAKISGYSVALDIPGTWEPVQSKLKTGKIPLDEVIQNNKVHFSKDIIKEPVLTFEYEKLKERFPQAKFVLILRDPRDNIRSILNRLKLPGDLEELTPLYQEKVGALWNVYKTVVYNQWQGVPYNHYIESMAGRWNLCADVYLNNSNDVLLIKYEDFLKDKVKSLENLAKKLNLPQNFSIENEVDKQYQPKGNKRVDTKEFFGKNLSKISDITSEKMRKVNYNI